MKKDMATEENERASLFFMKDQAWQVELARRKDWKDFIQWLFSYYRLRNNKLHNKSRAASDTIADETELKELECKNADRN
jgi:hypothetical protein